MTYRKKLIEVALPIQAINEESNRDKKLSSGHPTTLHYWWAPRPLPACRAVVFAALVDDPSAHPEQFPDEVSQKRERDRLFQLMERLIKWESRNNRTVLEEARHEIAKSTRSNPPRLVDPFCGRGLIPLEGQRLGLDVLAADVNPVAVTIAKSLVEILPKFVFQRPVNPDSRNRNELFKGGVGEGFADDIRYYAMQVLEKVRQDIEQYFPKYQVTKETLAGRKDLQNLRGKEMVLMGWVWARTITCSNPACKAVIPLVGSFWLSQKKGRKYWIAPQVNEGTKEVDFEIGYGEGQAPPPTKLPGTGGTFKCLVCKEDSDEDYVEQQGKLGNIKTTLMACIADGGRQYGRVYLPPTVEQERIAKSVTPNWKPEFEVPDYSQAMPTSRHGIITWADFFTIRQLLALDNLSRRVREIRGTITKDARAAGLTDDNTCLEDGGIGSRAYADAVVTFLGLIVGKQANRSCAFNFWDNGNEKIQQPFAQQGIQKTWDFVESNPFSESSGSWLASVDYPLRVIRESYPDIKPGHVLNRTVIGAAKLAEKVMVVTDPPYYDNIGYADLSDFFYIWLRRALHEVYPQTFSTILTPKTDELAAVRHRFGGDRKKAEEFFQKGFQDAFKVLRGIQSDEYPLCLFYAYKQKEKRAGESEASTGWETMLQGLVDSGLSVTGTWPVLSESTDTIKKLKGSLSTSVVLVCRPRPGNAETIWRRDFVARLRHELPTAVRLMQMSNLAPVDLAQAAIGPGMAVFSSYAKVIESDGSAMRVRTALQVINQVLDEALAEQESEYDSQTRWAIAWFESYGMSDGPFGTAENLSKSKGTSISGLEKSGIVVVRGSNARLLRRDELLDGWDPSNEQQLTAWEVVQHLIRILDQKGEVAASQIAASVAGDVPRDLAYRLFMTSERKGWTQEALAYNSLVVAWPELKSLASSSQAQARQLPNL